MNINLGRFLLRLDLEMYEGIIGVSSYFNKKANHHVGFFDLDKMPLSDCIMFCESIQKRHKIGTMIILQTSKGNYHAVCFDILPFKEYVMMNLWNPRYCGHSIIRGDFVLRVSSKKGNKIKYITTVKAKSKNVKSLTHINFFNKQFDINIKEPKSLTRPNGIVMHFYKAKIKR